MTLSDSGEAAVLDEIFEAGTGTFPTGNVFVSLHSANPGETGANEVTGGSYVRQQAATTRTGSAITNDAILSFSGMPAGDVVAWGIWDLSTAGVCFWTGWFGTVGRVGVVEAADLAGNDITSPAHGFANDDRVIMEQIEAETTPTGLTAGTIYWVTGAPTADTFQLSTTQDGGAVDITAVGVAMFRKVVVTTLGAGNTFQIAAGDLDIFLD
jgi:hypothetical protein